jgi:hypothetical protein
VQNSQVDRSGHGHHKIAAAIFAASLIVGAGLVLSAELMKPERYEFHSGPGDKGYIIYDRETGRATSADFGAKNPIESLK